MSFTKLRLKGNRRRAGDYSDTLARELGNVPFLDGVKLQHENASGELVDSVSMTDADIKVFRHGLGRPAQGFFVLSALQKSASHYTDWSLTMLQNAAEVDDKEFITIRCASTASRDTHFVIWVF